MHLQLWVKFLSSLFLLKNAPPYANCGAINISIILLASKCMYLRKLLWEFGLGASGVPGTFAGGLWDQNNFHTKAKMFLAVSPCCICTEYAQAGSDLNSWCLSVKQGDWQSLHYSPPCACNKEEKNASLT